MSREALEIRIATRAEVDLAVSWAAAEGWNPGVVDADCYLAADPNAFLVGLLDAQPIACISVVRYDDRFGFLGFYIVRPEFRGQGHGLRLWNAGLNYLHGCVVGLDGVVEQIGNYQKSGFRLAYRHLRFACQGGGEADGSGVVELSELPFEELMSYLAPFFPSAREAFFKRWINQPEAAALGLYKEGRLRAIGVCRPCLEGAKIGPLYADDPAAADQLFGALRSRVSALQPVFLDVPDCHRAALALAAAHEMEVKFECARMYKGPAPELPHDRIYGVTSMEIG